MLHLSLAPGHGTGLRKPRFNGCLGYNLIVEAWLNLLANFLGIKHLNAFQDQILSGK